MEGEAILLRRPQVTHDTARETVSSLGLDMEKQDSPSPYYVVRSRGLKEEWKNLRRKRALAGKMTPEIKTAFNRVRSQSVNFVRRLRRGELKKHFVTAAPNYIRRAFQAGDELSYNRYQWALTSLKMPQVWEKFGRGNRDEGKAKKEIIVAIVDSGVRRTHPNLERNFTEDGYDFVSDPTRDRDEIPGMDNNPDEPTDGQNENPFHGTHVAGIVAAVPDPRAKIGDLVVQIDGVAGGVKILPIRALAFDGGTDADIANAILYAAGLPNSSNRIPKRKADVINLSLGGAGESPILADAIERATAAGSVIVAAAGNDGNDQETFPAAYPQVIAVGAFEPGQSPALYSNFGPNVDVMAPGGGVPPEQFMDGIPNGILSTYVEPNSNESSWKFMSGTSMASPHVAGIVALLLGVNPALALADARELLFAHSYLENLQGCSNQRCGRGEPNVLEILSAAETAVPSTAKIQLTRDWVPLTDAKFETTLSIPNTGGDKLKMISGEEIRIRPVSAAAWLSVTENDTEKGIDLQIKVAKDKAPTIPQSVSVEAVTNAAEIETTENGDSTISHNGVIRLFVYYEPKETMHVALVKDSDDHAAFEWAAAQPDQKYAYHLDPPPEGDYFIYAGRDDDGDGKVCGVGDYCGAYPSLEQPRKIHVQPGTVMNDLDFDVTPNYLENFEISLPKPTEGVSP